MVDSRCGVKASSLNARTSYISDDHFGTITKRRETTLDAMQRGLGGGCPETKSWWLGCLAASSERDSGQEPNYRSPYRIPRRGACFQVAGRLRIACAAGWMSWFKEAERGPALWRNMGFSCGASRGTRGSDSNGQAGEGQAFFSVRRGQSICPSARALPVSPRSRTREVPCPRIVGTC